MKKTTIIESDTIAYLPSHGSIARFTRDLKEGKLDDACDQIAFSLTPGMEVGANPWTRLGTAKITVEVACDEELIASAIRTLRTEQQNVRAAAEIRSREIEQQIQSLLAINYDAPEAG